MKKLVCESLQELLERISDDENKWADEQIDGHFNSDEEVPERQTDPPGTYPIDRWESMIDELIAMGNPEGAFIKIDSIIQRHPAMEAIRNGAPIPDQYMSGLNRLVDHYKEYIQGGFDTRMN